MTENKLDRYKQEMQNIFNNEVKNKYQFNNFWKTFEQSIFFKEFQQAIEDSKLVKSYEERFIINQKTINRKNKDIKELQDENQELQQQIKQLQEELEKIKSFLKDYPNTNKLKYYFQLNVIFERIFGSSDEVRILNYLIENEKLEYSVEELQTHLKIPTLTRTFEILENAVYEKVLTQTNSHKYCFDSGLNEKTKALNDYRKAVLMENLDSFGV